ncbi:MAG: hypothetical protein VKL59_13630 [Nostocaceae cyanobacterium]|nr:hypothetical protein [Nostocaceae cyanobacterium]
MKSFTLVVTASIVVIMSVKTMLGDKTIPRTLQVLAVHQVRQEVRECVAYRDEYKKNNHAAIEKVEANDGEIKDRCLELGVNIDDNDLRADGIMP